MRITHSALAVILASLFHWSPIVHEVLADDPLSDQIQRLREGKKVSISDSEFYKLRSASFDKFYDVAAQVYIDQVRWSLIDPDDHGGWPVRSPLLMIPGVLEPIHQRLKAKSDETYDTIFDYALICPGLYMHNEAEVQKVLSRLKAKDAFLYKRANAELKSWRAYVSKQSGSKQ